MTILTTTEKFDFLSIESWCFMDRLKAVRDPGGGYSLIWPIRRCAAGQGMVFGLNVLNRVCDFVRVCPKQGI